MSTRSLTDWLRWQESLNPRGIDLGLARVRPVAAALALVPPPGRVFTVAGTNGKGSTVAFLDAMLRAHGLSTGVYTSPHLVRYNERIQRRGAVVTDAELVAAFEAVDRARAAVPLTYFEFGTLAALWLFTQSAVDAWVLEVGLGGRLDAVNVVDPDVSLITTVDLDHQAWLGDTVEAIAAEKAGILRAGRPAAFGEAAVPAAIRGAAASLGADLAWPGHGFNHERVGSGWTWQGRTHRLAALPVPEPGDEAQLRNASLALAGLEAAGLPLRPEAVAAALRAPRPAGRFQRVLRAHEWLLDVAHNPQAARVLAARLAELPAAGDTTVVLGLFADKNLEDVAAALQGLAKRWITCTAADARGREAATLAAALRALMPGEVLAADSPADALARAAELTAPGGRIIVCGSFRVVGPALEWLGLY